MFSLSRQERIMIAWMAAISVTIFIYMYFNMSSIREFDDIKPFKEDIAEVEIKDELEIDNELLEIQQSAAKTGEVKNIAQNANDSRKKSFKDWSENKASSAGSSNPEQTAKDFEKQLFREAGGEKEREKIRQEMADRKKNAATSNNSNSSNKTNSNQSGKNNQYAGNVMVDFSLSGRTAYDNNNWFIRNPGYTCGQDSGGTVYVLVSVDKSGRVISAICDDSKSINATECMREQALKYASISKFNPSETASTKQDGYIRYRFVAQ
ncbi:MAG: hypothetical protein EBQ94_03275 [Flavobacteriales bacterium]|nr:hypothetical protein [Flavobacteriales bacterium]NCA20479.1 hypothetical protein [Crocinitomicaceae bacterium]